MATSTLGPAPESAKAVPSTNGATPTQATTAQGDLMPREKPTPQQLPPAIEGFEKLINKDLKAYLDASKKIGGLVADQAESVKKSFEAERKFLLVTTKAKKPDIQSPAYMSTLKELQETIGAVDGVRVANRGSPFSDHLTTVSEGIPMLGWVTVDAKPEEHVTEMLNAAEFYGNRVWKEYRNKDTAHIEWVQSYGGVCKALRAYIKEFYPKGMTWNPQGVDAAQAMQEVAKGAISTAPASYVPPPPPPLPQLDSPVPSRSVSQKSTAGGPSDMSAVFDQLSQGEAVTWGLKKVDPSQQTHMNPSLRSQGNATSSSLQRSDSASSLARKSPVPGKKPNSMRTKKPPRKVLESTKWYVENFDGPSEMVEIDAQQQHSVLISHCSKTTVRINGKANAISIDSCSGLALVIDSLVSAVDVVKTGKFQMQVLGVLPTILLDQVDDAQVYLSKDSLSTEIFTSKCSGVNVNIPPSGAKGEEDDYRECAVPEQIKTVIKNGKAVSEIVEHMG